METIDSNTIKRLFSDFAKEIKSKDLDQETENQIIDNYIKKLDETNSSLQNLLAKQIGFYYWEFDIKNKKMRAPFQHLSFPEMPTFLDNYPKSFLAKDYIHSTSKQKFLDLHTKVSNGVKEAETIVRLNSRFSTEDSFYVKYTTQFNEKGEPYKAIGTAHKLPGYNELEDNYYITMHDAGICLWTVDLENRMIIPFSQSVRLYGNIPVEFGSQEKLLDVIRKYSNIHPEDVEKHIEAYTKLLNGERKLSVISRRKNIQTDQWDWLKGNYTLIVNKTDKPIKILINAVNITELIKAKEKYRLFKNYSLISKHHTLANFYFNLTTNHCTNKEINKNIDSNLFDTSSIDNFFISLSKLFALEGKAQEFLQTYNRENLIKMYKKGNTNFSCEQKINMEHSIPKWRFFAIDIMENPDTKNIESFFYIRDIDQKITLNQTINKLIQNDYETIGLIDKNSGYYTNFESKTSGLSVETDNQIYDEIIISKLKSIINESDYEKSIEALSLKTIVENLEKQETYFCKFPIKLDNQWRMWKYSYLDSSKTTIFFSLSDITSVIQTELNQKALLSTALDQARHASMLKTEFLSRMSHEIRTPMNAIIGMTNLALDSISDQKSIEDCLNKIGISAKFLLSLINDILDMSRIESGKVFLKEEEVNIQNFINDINCIFTSQAEDKNINYSCIFVNELQPFYIFDSMKVQQILINIIGNAMKFTKPYGKVTLKIKQEKVNKNAALVRFVISDNGIGISKEFLPNLFNVFEQEHTGFSSSYRGTGLGLAICKNLIELMNGTISVTSNLGQGTEFNILLKLKIPETKNLPQSLNEKPQIKDYSVLNGKKILLCEDHELNIEVAKRLLESKGIIVSVAKNGQEGFEKFIEAPEFYFNAILMDIRMPILNGLEATSKIRKINSKYANSIPIIAMSANAFEEDVEKSINTGMNAHIAKPFEPSFLFDTLASFL